MSFKIGNVSIYISFTFICLILFVLITAESTNIPVTLACSLLHELGHFFALFLSGEKNFSMKISFFGGEICRNESYKTNYILEFFVHIAGPLVNLLLALVFLLCNNISLFETNTAIAVFNLLPIDNLDGGKALYSLFCTRRGHNFAKRLIFLISLFVCIPLILISFVSVIENEGNIQLVFVLVYILLMLILKK